MKFILSSPAAGWGTDDEVGYGRLTARSGAGLSAKMGALAGAKPIEGRFPASDTPCVLS